MDACALLQLQRISLAGAAEQRTDLSASAKPDMLHSSIVLNPLALILTVSTECDKLISTAVMCF